MSVCAVATGSADAYAVLRTRDGFGGADVVAEVLPSGTTFKTSIGTELDVTGCVGTVANELEVVFRPVAYGSRTRLWHHACDRLHRRGLIGGCWRGREGHTWEMGHGHRSGSVDEQQRGHGESLKRGTGSSSEQPSGDACQADERDKTRRDRDSVATGSFLGIDRGFELHEERAHVGVPRIWVRRKADANRIANG